MTVEEIYLNCKIIMEDGYGNVPVYVSDGQGNSDELSLYCSKPRKFDIKEHWGGGILELEEGDLFITAGVC